uniref:Uncharacterized protein n=1 Tax=Arundo donax TaxID=35708 RepID=A0A0A8ZCG3_ARUDO
MDLAATRLLKFLAFSHCNLACDVTSSFIKLQISELLFLFEERIGCLILVRIRRTCAEKNRISCSIYIFF